MNAWEVAYEYADKGAMKISMSDMLGGIKELLSEPWAPDMWEESRGNYPLDWQNLVDSLLPDQTET